MSPDRKAEPNEPTNLRELFAQATADLKTQPQGCILRWSFWHARAVGRLEVARYGLKRLEQQDAEAWTRSLAMEHISSVAEAYQDARPLKMLANFEEVVVEAAAYAEASRSVIELLRSK